MNVGCNSRELHQQRADVIDNFKRIKPHPWNECILALKLCGKVGSLTHVILGMEDCKRRRSDLAAIRTEYTGVKEDGCAA